MLAVARSFQAVNGVPISWYEGSALALPFGKSEFGVVLCQFGLQFLPDPLVALREMRRILEPQGRVAVSVFAEIARNPVALALSDALDRHLGDGASDAKRNEHSLGDAEALDALFRESGFARVRIETVTRTSHYPSVSEYVRFQLEATPLAAALAGCDEPERDRCIALLVEELQTRLAPFASDQGLAFPQVAHVATSLR